MKNLKDENQCSILFIQTILDLYCLKETMKAIESEQLDGTEINQLKDIESNIKEVEEELDMIFKTQASTQGTLKYFSLKK
ncbi:hypothetical protein D1631_13420 [Chryseobacterium nematophagum]|uniref:Uncharacterized protein n=1 Tax=Chryseobacterium nematophagum TaxID=2305228 RepID=A0A3M7TKW6_9FLAO|nr:hypothetical protein [Chryseobacterium nematophagum]RNA62860.1 hypothetical protein D1631_13420 [Chryseobacterium nematophagum]